MRSIATQLRTVPRGGIGYGLARYLSRDNIWGRDRLGDQPAAEVSWNYLGLFDHVLPYNSLLRLERGGYGGERSRAAGRSYLLDITAFISRGCLQTEWTYSHEIHRRETIARLAETFMAELRAVIALGHATMASEAPVESFELAELDESAFQKVSTLLERIDTSEGRPA